MTRILLVEPNFPIPPKSRNHKNFLPIGLLKIASYLRDEGHEVKLVRGTPITIESTTDIIEFNPKEIWITSLFTYWSTYVRDAVHHYKRVFPRSRVVVGGIYASLRPKNEVIEYTGADEVVQGVLLEAEKRFPAYDLLNTNGSKFGPVDYQILHSSRGCPRKCRFCGTWIIEPAFVPKKSIKDEIRFRKIVFYDNNFFMNPHVKDILLELAELKRQKKIEWCESQSGFDGRIMLKDPELARMIRNAGFRYPRIAWDWRYSEYKEIKSQIGLLLKAGYSSKDISIFVLYNWDVPFEEMEKKRVKCWNWKVQISDCRYRPLDQLFDDYDPKTRNQTSSDYYIHEKAGWTDELVKTFRQNVRRQNICVREGLLYYSSQLERMNLSRTRSSKIRNLRYSEAKDQLDDAWNPARVTRVSHKSVHSMKSCGDQA